MGYILSIFDGLGFAADGSTNKNTHKIIIVFFLWGRNGSTWEEKEYPGCRDLSAVTAKKTIIANTNAKPEAIAA